MTELKIGDKVFIHRHMGGNRKRVFTINRIEACPIDKLDKHYGLVNEFGAEYQFGYHDNELEPIGEVIFETL